MDVLFAAIRTPILKHFVLHLRYEIDFDTREYCHSVRAQLNVFLRGFCGLETLLLQTRLLPQTVAYDVLQQHAPTLRIYLSDMSGWPDLFLSSCFKALKQYSIYKVNDFLEPGYRTVIANFCNSTPLTTLNILFPPVDDPLKPWKESLHDLADTIFAATTGSKLRVLAFGLDHDTSWLEEICPRAVTYPNRLCFIRRRGSNGSAEGSGLAVEVDEKEVRWLEPESDIIQYRFSA